MARRKQVEEDFDIEPSWLDKLGNDVTKALDKDCTQRELRSILVQSYIDLLKGQVIKDGAKVIETILKIAPAKADPIENELEEPVATVSHAEQMIKKIKKPRLVSSESILADGEKEKLSATVSEPYRSGDPIVYSKEAPRDAMEDAIEEVALGKKRSLEPKFIKEEYIPESVMQENIPGEKMTMEEGMTFDKIRKNIESDTYEKHPRESTESIKEVFELSRKRAAATPPPKPELPKDEAREKAKRDWAEFQAKLLEISRSEEQ